MTQEELNSLKPGDKIYFFHEGVVTYGMFHRRAGSNIRTQVWSPKDSTWIPIWLYQEYVFLSKKEALRWNIDRLQSEVIPENTKLVKEAQAILNRNHVSVQKMRDTYFKILNSERLTEDQIKRTEWINRVLEVMSQAPEGFYANEVHRISLSLTKILDSWKARRPYDTK